MAQAGAGVRWEVRGNWADSGIAKIVQFIRNNVEETQVGKDDAAGAGAGAGFAAGAQAPQRAKQYLNLSQHFVPSWSSSGKTPIGPFLFNC